MVMSVDSDGTTRQYPWIVMVLHGNVHGQGWYHMAMSVNSDGTTWQCPWIVMVPHGYVRG